MPQWFLRINPPGREVVQFYANLWDAYGCTDRHGLCNPAAVSVNHHQAQRLHTGEAGSQPYSNKTTRTNGKKGCYHDHLHSLGYRVGFVVLLLHYSREVAQLPDWVALLTLTGQLWGIFNQCDVCTNINTSTHS